MKSCLILTLLITYTTVSFGSEFASINIKNWKKEELAHDHLRFTNQAQKKLMIHLQVDSYNKDHFWNEKNLANDIADMAAIRKNMSSFFGTSEYQINTFKLDSQQAALPKLYLNGTYRRLGGQLIRFIEINFYHKEHFLQFKIISEGKIPTSKEIDDLIKEINPSEVDIN